MKLTLTESEIQEAVKEYASRNLLAFRSTDILSVVIKTEAIAHFGVQIVAEIIVEAKEK